MCGPHLSANVSHVVRPRIASRDGNGTIACVNAFQNARTPEIAKNITVGITINVNVYQNALQRPVHQAGFGITDSVIAGLSASLSHVQIIIIGTLILVNVFRIVQAKIALKTGSGVIQNVIAGLNVRIIYSVKDPNIGIMLIVSVKKFVHNKHVLLAISGITLYVDVSPSVDLRVATLVITGATRPVAANRTAQKNPVTLEQGGIMANARVIS